MQNNFPGSLFSSISKARFFYYSTSFVFDPELDQSYYKGFTEDLLLRLKRHNNGESAYTRNKMPWHFVYIEPFSSKTEALKREKALKKYSHAQVEQLITSAKNQITRYWND